MAGLAANETLVHTWFVSTQYCVFRYTINIKVTQFTKEYFEHLSDRQAFEFISLSSPRVRLERLVVCSYLQLKHVSLKILNFLTWSIIRNKTLIRLK